MSSHFAMSLDMINRHYQEPNRNRYETRQFWEELYPLIAAAGFDHIEVPFEPVWQFGGRSGVPMTSYSIETKYGNSESYRALLASAGIRGVSAVTFTPNLFVRNPHMDFYFGAFGHFATQAIGFARDLGADILVLSPSAYAGRLFHYHPGLKEDAGDFIVRTLTLFTELAEKAKDEGVKLGLRPEYWSILPVSTVVDFCRQQDNVELVVNTAHIALSGSDPSAFLNANLDITAYVQLSDTKLEDSSTFARAPNPEFPPQQATQVFCDAGQGRVPVNDILERVSGSLPPEKVCFSNHHTRDPMRAMLRNRALINQHCSQTPLSDVVEA